MTKAKNMTLSRKVLVGLERKMAKEPWLKSNVSRTVDEILYKTLVSEGYIDDKDDDVSENK